MSRSMRFFRSCVPRLMLRPETGAAAEGGRWGRRAAAGAGAAKPPWSRAERSRGGWRWRWRHPSARKPYQERIKENNLGGGRRSKGATLSGTRCCCCRTGISGTCCCCCRRRAGPADAGGRRRHGRTGGRPESGQMCRRHGRTESRSDVDAAMDVPPPWTDGAARRGESDVVAVSGAEACR
jgi:hypothetical protein